MVNESLEVPSKSDETKRVEPPENANFGNFGANARNDGSSENVGSHDNLGNHENLGRDEQLSFATIFNQYEHQKPLQTNLGLAADDGFQLVDNEADDKEKEPAVQAAIEAAVLTPLADAPKPGSKPESAEQPAADKAPSEKSTPQEKAAKTAADFEKRGRESVEASHKTLKVTTDGSTPKVIELKDNFKVQQESTALDIAKTQLGPNATKDQLELYAQRVAYTNATFEGSAKANSGSTKANGDSTKTNGDSTKANGDSTKTNGDSTKANGDSTKANGDSTKANGDSTNVNSATPQKILLASDPIDTKFPSGSAIKLPGQTADGGIVTRQAGVTTTDWSDRTQLQISENGQGRASFENNGAQTNIHWNPAEHGDNSETRTNQDAETTIDAAGRSTERKYIETNKATGDGEWFPSKISSSDEKGRTFVQEFQLGKPMPEKIVITNADKSVVELKPNGSGEYLSADGKTGMTEHFDIYARQTSADGSTKRTYDTGNIEQYDKKGRIVHAEGKDGWDRVAAYDYKAGEKAPNKVTLTTKDGANVALTRQRNGGYSGDNLDASGSKIGTVSVGEDGRLIYRNDKEKTARAELKDGTSLEKRQNPDGTSTFTSTKGKEGFVVEYDKKGVKTSEAYTGADGRKFSKEFNGKKIDTVKIEGGDGSKTELKFDDKAEALRGQRVDAQGNVLEQVTLQEDKLVFVDSKTGDVRTEKYQKPDQDGGLPKFVKGTYDKDSGTFTYTNNDNLKTVESFAPGRSDVTKTDGTVSGSTVSGDNSTLKPNGEASVLHANGTGVRLNADSTVDRWGSNPADDANKEKLAPTEESYLKSHNDADRRDVAELHRRLGGDAAKLDSFYKELEKVDTAKNLSSPEKASLRKDILRHAAYPGEIYQGRSPSCNVSVVQRDIVMNSPDRYAAQIVGAVSEGKVTVAGGTDFTLDPANLKLQDSSGRDLASRIFQTTALAAEFHPKGVFRNTEDGVGRVYPAPYNAADKPAVFAGLNMAQITDVRYKLTGEEKALVLVDNAAELKAAFDAGSGKPMIVAVNGQAPPFEGTGPVGKGSTNHVVTVVAVENGKVYFHNQWGLQADHSTHATAVDANKLVDNMKVRVVVDGKVVKGPAMVLSNGTHDRAYDVKNGRLVEDRALSRTLKKGVGVMPK